MLLAPRYRVLIDFPGSDYSIGDIIGLTNLDSNEYYSMDEDGAVIEQESFYKKFPDVFKKLEWWEDRKPEEMPEYVKLNPENTTGGPEVFKVLSVKEFVDGIGICHTYPPDESSPFENFVGAKYFLPATSADYKDSIIKSLIQE